MKGIMLHCGADSITRSELASLPVPGPMGPRHFIRPFIDDVSLISDLLYEIGMPVIEETFGVTVGEDGSVPKQFFGLMQVGDNSDAGFSTVIGLRGSYDQTLSRGIAVGSNVFVCDNLCFSGEVVIKTKQTLSIDDRIAFLLRDAIDQVPDIANTQEARFEDYKLTRIGVTVGNSMLTDMVRTGVLNASQIGKALAEWDNPSHDEHAEDGWTLWRLHNAVTEAIKPAAEHNAVRRNWDRTINMTALLDTEVSRRHVNAAARQFKHMEEVAA